MPLNATIRGAGAPLFATIWQASAIMEAPRSLHVTVYRVARERGGARHAAEDALVERGVNPEALAAVVRELRREAAALKSEEG